MSDAPPKLLSVITPVYNEELNVRRCHEEVARVCRALAPELDYEHIFADNCSTDGTLAILKELAAADPRVRVLSWSRNFGAEKSGFHALRYTRGDITVGIMADLQEPPDVIPAFVAKWREGFEVVYGVYRNPHEPAAKRALRALYYWLVDKLSPDPLPHNFSGFALLDRVVIDQVLRVDDFMPYTRGIVVNVGFRQAGIPYERRQRDKGASKHGFAFLFGFAVNGMITHSLMPIRLATLLGLTLSGVAVFTALAYVFIKLFVSWNFQAPGATTTIALVSFFAGIQLLFFGILGEYIGAIHSQVRRRPFVILREQLNVDPAVVRRVEGRDVDGLAARDVPSARQPRTEPAEHRG